MEMSPEFVQVLAVVVIVLALLWGFLADLIDGNVRMYQGQTLARPAQRVNVRMYQGQTLARPAQRVNVRMYQGQTLARPAQRGPVDTWTAPRSNTQLNEASSERYRNGVWELDLHGMYTHEADTAANSFLRKHSDKTRVRIITGRGLHSEMNQPVLKPHIISLISQRGLKYKVVSKGGCIDIYPNAPHLHNRVDPYLDYY